MQHATETYARTTSPAEWATAQNDLGAALWLLARKTDSTVDLEKARQALSNALLERDRQNRPLEWAETQVNLGGVFLDLAVKEGSSSRYMEAIEALRGALKNWPPSKVGSIYAQNNLGVALMTLGRRDNNVALLEEAIAEFQNLIDRSSPAARPDTLVNLGRCLTLVGAKDESDKGTEDLRRSVTVLDLANNVIERKKQPMLWASAQSNRGLALRQLGLRTHDVSQLEGALAAFNLTIDVWTRSQAPVQWADAQQNLGLVLRNIGQFSGELTWFNKSEDAFRAALTERPEQRNPTNWLYSTWELGKSVRMIAEKTRDTGKAKDAVEILTKAREEANSIASQSDKRDIEESLNLAQKLMSDLTSSH